MKKLYFLLLFTFFCGITKVTNAQIKPGSLVPHSALNQSFRKLPKNYLHKVTRKTQQIKKRITRRTQKALTRLQKQEEKSYKKLTEIDSLAAHTLLAESIDSLSKLREALQSKALRLDHEILGSAYIPYLDTVKNILGFLQKYQGESAPFNNALSLTGKWKDVTGFTDALQQAKAGVNHLNSRMKQLQNIQKYIQQQQTNLQENLRKYGDVFDKPLAKFSKTVYYYKARLKNYKKIWQDPDKVETEVLGHLRKLPVFKKFMKKHAALAALFNRTGANAGSLEEQLQGLQTRAMIQQELQQRLQSEGGNDRAKMKKQIAKAKQKLRQLKDRLSGGGNDATMPNFKPDDMKTKTFFQRLKFGGNIQFNKTSAYLPMSSDIAGQIAYAFSEKGSIGVGASFKLGWNNPLTQQNLSFQDNSVSTIGNVITSFPASFSSFNNFFKDIHFTARGVGLRSFIDYKLKGAFYINGGFEMNYNKTIPNIPELKELNGWEMSALLGIEKKYKIIDKLKGTMMLLFDFLYKEHVPQTRPLIFRIGYNF